MDTNLSNSLEADRKAAGTGSVEAAAKLDAHGFLIKPGEKPSEYAARVEAILKHSAEIQAEFDSDKTPSQEIYPGIRVSPKNRIPQEIIQEAAAITEKAYGFAVNWTHGWFPDRELGPLWGGCALSDEEDDSVPVFIIRSSFRKKKKWFIYDRSELLSHELSHTARMPLHDKPLEEHFAYALSGSRFRRAVGNCFQTDWDAILFIAPVLLLLCVQICVFALGLFKIPTWPFWVLIFVWPLFLLIRNVIQTGRFRKAEKNLAAAGFTRPKAVLFRCLSPEIFRFAKMTPQEILAETVEKAKTELRWKVLCFRFTDPSEHFSD